MLLVLHQHFTILYDYYLLIIGELFDICSDTLKYFILILFSMN